MRTWERTFLRISDAFGRCRSVMVEKSGTTSPLGTLPHLRHAKKHEDATVHVLIYLTLAFSKNRSPGIPDLVQEGEEVAVKYLAMEINGTGSGGAAPVSCWPWPLASAGKLQLLCQASRSCAAQLDVSSTARPACKDCIWKHPET